MKYFLSILVAISALTACNIRTIEVANGLTISDVKLATNDCPEAVKENAKVVRVYEESNGVENCKTVGECTTVVKVSRVYTVACTNELVITKSVEVKMPEAQKEMK